MITLRRSVRKSRPSTIGTARASIARRLPRTLRSLFVLAFLLSGCQTAPKKETTSFSGYKEGVWHGRAIIKDLLKGKTNVVDIDVVASRPYDLRIEVTTTLGIHLARFTMNKDVVSYMLTRRKEYYRGAPKRESLLPVLSVGMNPRLLMTVLFDETPDEKGWLCDKDDHGFLKTCKNPDQGLVLEWKDRQGERRVAVIRSKSADVQLELKEFLPTVAENERVFHIDPPKGFRVIDVE